MTNTKHTFTPGPWIIDNESEYGSADICEKVSENVRHAMVHIGHPIKGDAKANAYLIAAAPELLEALENILNAKRNSNGEYPELLSFLVKPALEAIAKARGE